MFERNPVPMWVFRKDDLRFLAVNEAAIAHYGYSREQFLAMTATDIRPPEDRDEFRRVVGSVSRKFNAGEFWHHLKADGTKIDVAIFPKSLTYDGHAALLVAAIDVTERNRTEAKLRDTQEFLDTILENIPVSIFVKKVDDLRYVLVNRASEQLMGISRERMLGKTAAEVFPAPAAEIVVANDERRLASSDQIFFEEVAFETPGNGTRLVEAKRIVLRDEGVPKYIVGVVEDVTARKEAEARITHLAHRDPLTDLPHNATFRQHLETVLERAIADKQSIAVLRVDLDRFKEANDVLGASAGDVALREVAARFRTAAEGAYLARSGGDEFALIAEGSQPAGAEALAERLREAMSSEIDLGGQTIRIGASIGVAVFPGDGDNATTLMANADAALHRAKSDGRGTVRFFDSAMDMRLRERRALQHELRSAVPHELVLHYQPQLRADGKLIGFESLLRWQHPTRGLISAAQFIPVAEDSGQIFAIGAWVLREACREAAAWPGVADIAVNLSSLQFRQGNLPALVRATLSETGLPPARLELEITESLLIDDHVGALAILRELKGLGIRIALDDFGTGYSSLSYLQSFPFDKIKIDRSFVSNLENSEQSASIIRAIIALAHGLKLPVLAEGVENDAQRAFLVREGCDELQGFLFGAPGPIAEYADLLNGVKRVRPHRPDAA
jgi:diguanylate cyclase (GGDEF)-like protein/PAS domain S-box-containing protein